MDVNALASQYGSGETNNNAKSSTPTVEDSKIHDLAAQYGSDEKAKEVGDTIKKGERLYVSPHPPISGPNEPLPQPIVKRKYKRRDMTAENNSALEAGDYSWCMDNDKK